VFDVGASHGAFLAELGSHRWRIGGIEPAESDAAHATERLGVPIEVGFFGSRYRSDRTWTVVTCWDVLEHTTEPADFLAALFELVEPGGLLAFSVPHIDGLPARVLGARWRYAMPPFHLHFFPVPWIEAQACVLGADVADISGFAKVHAWTEGLAPRKQRGRVISAMPHRTRGDQSASRTASRVGVRLLRRAVLNVNQTPCPLLVADLLEVILRKKP
jgi:SAM-dependent methyltransferase